MLTRNFTYGRDSELGIWGLKPNWMPNADPTGGLGCAHDMLDHFGTQTSALEGECEAIGAFLRVRLKSGWNGIGRRPSRDNWDVAIAAEIRACLMDAVEEELQLPSSIRTKPLPALEEQAVTNGVREAFRQIEGEGLSSAGLARLNERGVQDAFCAWVRKGYRKAGQRYLRIDQYGLTHDLVPKIVRTVDGLRNGYLTEGDKVGISLNLQTMSIYIRINDEPVDYFH